MVIPTIFCCESCVCSGNTIDFDFDFDSDDEETNSETTPILKQPITKTYKTIKNNTVFYFYFKEGIPDDNNDMVFIVEYIKGLKLGNINNIQFVKRRSGENPDDLFYIKISYRSLTTKFKNYYSKINGNELIVGLFIGDKGRKAKRIFNKNSGLNGVLMTSYGKAFYNIEHCLPVDILMWICDNKPIAWFNTVLQHQPSNYILPSSTDERIQSQPIKIPKPTPIIYTV